MDIFQTALLIGAVVVAAVNFNQPRALLWIALGAANFVLTDLYFYYAIPWLPHAFVTGVADAFLVILLATFGVHRWERFVRYAFALSVLLSMAYLLGWIPDRTSYAIGLEGCNWLALLVMFGTGVLRLADARVDHGFMGSGSRTGLGRYLHWARVVCDAERRPTGVVAKAFGQA